MNDDIFLNPDAYQIQHLHNVKCYDHLHYQTELAFVLVGKLTIKHEMSEVVLNANEGMFIMPYEIHGYKSEEGTEAVIINFNRLMIDELANRNGFGGVPFGISAGTISYVKSMLSEKRESIVFLKSIIYSVLVDFFEEYKYVETALRGGEIYHAALDFIDNNFGDDINLKTAAEHIGCSYVHLSRIFSKSTGISFTSYLNRYRIVSSVADLRLTDLNITEIAYKNGFGTLRSYNREFKRIFNMTPGEYRKNSE